MKGKAKFRQQRRQNERAKNKDTLALMLQAERRDITIVSVLDNTIPDQMADPFDRCETVSEFVAVQMVFDENVRGEIDATGQEHYLDGDNYDEMMCPEYWDERRYP